jgi:hypothetical protein
MDRRRRNRFQLLKHATVLGRAKPRRRSRKERSSAASRAANAGLLAGSVSAASAAADPAVGPPAPARYARSAADAPASSVDFGGSSRSCRPCRGERHGPGGGVGGGEARRDHGRRGPALGRAQGADRRPDRQRQPDGEQSVTGPNPDNSTMTTGFTFLGQFTDQDHQVRSDPPARGCRRTRGPHPTPRTPALGIWTRCSARPPRPKSRALAALGFANCVHLRDRRDGRPPTRTSREIASVR